MSLRSRAEQPPVNHSSVGQRRLSEVLQIGREASARSVETARIAQSNRPASANAVINRPASANAVMIEELSKKELELKEANENIKKLHLQVKTLAGAVTVQAPPPAARDSAFRDQVKQLVQKDVELKEANVNIKNLNHQLKLKEKEKADISAATMRLHMQKTWWKTSSPPVSHPKMGAASVLDGCPLKTKQTSEVDGDVCLFIIDPQVDFHEGGSLAVRGATHDSKKIASILERFGKQIDQVVVTLDTHHKMHIAHPCFWTDAKGNSPKAFTPITHADLVNGTWKPRQKEMEPWVKTYCRELEGKNKFVHMIWPEHCLLGSPGHAVSPDLLPALQKWSKTHERSITWVLKGQNNRTEMYSALKAEVEVEDDPTTKINTKLIETLKSHKHVIVCGEAKSHCVNYTLRDLLANWNQPRVENDIVLVQDGTSPVDFYAKVAKEFEDFVIENGVLVAKSTSAEFRSIFGVPEFDAAASLVEAKSKLQVVKSVDDYLRDSATAKDDLANLTPTELKPIHDELYEKILRQIESEAVTHGLPLPPSGADFEDLRKWNKERTETEIGQIIDSVTAPAKGVMSPTALFVVGHSASGKSTFINKIFLPDQHGAFFYINPDVLGQFFCGSHKTFVDMKKHNLMSGDAAALDSAHKDLNDVRFKFVSQETMRKRKHAVLDSNRVPPSAVDDWRRAGYNVRVAFVEASCQGSVEAADEDSKIESKVAHGLKNDDSRERNGGHSNRSLITAQRLTDCRQQAANLHSELGVEVQVYISSGGNKGYMKLGKIGDKDLPLNKEYGFLTNGEKPDDEWQFKDVALKMYGEMANDAPTFQALRNMLHDYGIDNFKEELQKKNIVDKDGILTTENGPFNPFARFAKGVDTQPEMKELNKLLDPEAQDLFMVLANRKDNDEKYKDNTSEWLGKASMSGHHRFLTVRDLNWKWFNVLTFGIDRSIPELTKAIVLIKKMVNTAQKFATDAKWSQNLGLYFHCFPHNSVQALHMHLVDLDEAGPSYGHQRYKNLPVDDVLSVLHAELAVAVAEKQAKKKK